MDHFTRTTRAMWVRRGVSATALLLVVTGCATVKQDQFDSELSQLRQEMQEGDEAVESRLMSEIERVESQVTSLTRDLTAFRDEYEVTVERMETAVRFNAPVHFGFDEAEIQPQDRELLDRFADVVATHYGNATITVEGFADPAGSQAYNLQLGERRAEAVKSYLEDAGVPSDRMRAVSYGSADERQMIPGAMGPGEEGWENRRVAMVIDFNPSSSEAPRVADGREDGN